MTTSVFTTGFLTSAGLIVAIGAQNSFVLRQGIRREHVLTVSGICFLCDVLLMTCGVLGTGGIINNNKFMMMSLTVTGILFLLCYGLNSLKSAWKGNSHLILNGEGQSGKSTKSIAVSTLAISLLNPHVWLDTVAIIGGISSTVPGNMKLHYLFGALVASFIWFFSIGYFASLLAGLFSRRITWRILDSIIGCYMIFMAWKLYGYMLHYRS